MAILDGDGGVVDDGDGWPGPNSTARSSAVTYSVPYIFILFFNQANRLCGKSMQSRSVFVIPELWPGGQTHRLTLN